MNRKEQQRLKAGHVEEDNTDYAYLNFPLNRATFFFSAVSTAAFTAAIILSLRTKSRPESDDSLLDGSLIVKYGGKPFRCTTPLPFPDDALPSLINMFEINVFGNVLFRVATCLTIVIRVFFAQILRNSVSLSAEDSKWKHAKRILGETIPMTTSLETVSLAMFSIVTIHTDFKELNLYCKSVFLVASCAQMFMTTFTFYLHASDTQKTPDLLSLLVKAIATGIYMYTAPQYFRFHRNLAQYPICHAYIPSEYAILEYTMFIAYFIFNATFLIDTRNIHFVCYPRSCSGELEKLEPERFAKDGPFEHCRSFEYNQKA